MDCEASLLFHFPLGQSRAGQGKRWDDRARPGPDQGFCGRQDCKLKCIRQSFNVGLWWGFAYAPYALQSHLSYFLPSRFGRGQGL